MNDQEKKEAIDAEVVEEGEKKEKKENGFSKFFNKAKASVNNAILEGKIENAYNDKNLPFTIYSKDSTLGLSVHGNYLNDDKTEMIIFGEKEVKKNSVVINTKDNSAYYVVDTKEGKVTSTVEGVEYERKGTVICLNKDVEEVNVIKAGKRYFIYKG
jgi:hypothetical protein